MHRAYFLVFLLAGCAGPMEAEPASDEPVQGEDAAEVDEHPKREYLFTDGAGCRTLRIFVDLDREAVQAALPDGYGIEPSQTDYPWEIGTFHVYACAARDDGPAFHLAFAATTVDTSPSHWEHQFPYDYYAFDVLTDDEALAAELAGVGWNASLASFRIDSTPATFDYVISNDDLTWTGTHVRPATGADETPESLLGLAFERRWHRMSPAGNVYMQSEEWQSTVNAMTPNYAATRYEFQGGTYATLLYEGSPQIVNSMDWTSELGMRFAGPPP